ncbi:MAG: hypothetical protein ACU836_04655 [Gammaproteobacteria bacterium]
MTEKTRSNLAAYLLEQRQVDWSEIATEVDRNIGHSYSLADDLDLSVRIS